MSGDPQLVKTNNLGAKNLGKILKAFRLRTGITTVQLAEKAGVSPSFIRGIERGIQAPSIATTRKIIKHLTFKDVLPIWVDDPNYDLAFCNKMNREETRFKFASEIQGQNTRIKKEMLYDRDALVSTLVYHWPTKNSGCHCGWAELGKSWAVHVADVYEQVLKEG